MEVKWRRGRGGCTAASNVCARIDTLMRLRWRMKEGIIKRWFAF